MRTVRVPLARALARCAPAVPHAGTAVTLAAPTVPVWQGEAMIGLADVRITPKSIVAWVALLRPPLERRLRYALAIVPNVTTTRAGVLQLDEAIVTGLVVTGAGGS
jgi:hypothetical protein